jgi:Spy/CpxP family protein refolding chaperone
MRLAACIFLLTTAVLALGQQQPAPGPDPLGDSLFPPEMLMQNQEALGLTQEQRDSLKAELRKAQTEFTEQQWRLQDEVEKLARLMKQARVDEAQALAQLDKVLQAEQSIKRAQISLLIRLKNQLTQEQQNLLQELRNKSRPR